MEWGDRVWGRGEWLKPVSVGSKNGGKWEGIGGEGGVDVVSLLVSTLSAVSLSVCVV